MKDGPRCKKWLQFKKKTTDFSIAMSIIYQSSIYYLPVYYLPIYYLPIYYLQS